MNKQQSIYSFSTELGSENCVCYSQPLPFPLLPQLLSPLPRYYRSGLLQYCGKSAVTTVFPWSPLLYSSLLQTSLLLLCILSTEQSTTMRKIRSSATLAATANTPSLTSPSLPDRAVQSTPSRTKTIVKRFVSLLLI